MRTEKKGLEYAHCRRQPESSQATAVHKTHPHQFRESYQVCKDNTPVSKPVITLHSGNSIIPEDERLEGGAEREDVNGDQALAAQVQLRDVRVRVKLVAHRLRREEEIEGQIIDSKGTNDTKMQDNTKHNNCYEEENPTDLDWQSEQKHSSTQVSRTTTSGRLLMALCQSALGTIARSFLCDCHRW